MIEAYFTDEIKLFSRTVDQARNATDVESDHACRVERTDRIVKDQDGKDRQASYLVFLSPGVAIKVGDSFIITKLNGTDTGETKKWPITSPFDANGFEASHIEVIV